MKSTTHSLLSWRGCLAVMIFSFVVMERMSLHNVLNHQGGVVENGQLLMTAPEQQKQRPQSSNDAYRLTTSSQDNSLVDLDAGSCFPHNTQAWLNGERLSNAHDDNLSSPEQDFLDDQILSPPWKLFSHASKQTVCHADSTFRNPKDLWNVNDEKLVDEWELRLLFLALHHHQHAPARREALARKSCPPSSLTNRPDVIMNYECPSAKLLVVNLEPIGMGASFRLGAIGSLLLGVATGRTTLFVNNLTGIVSEEETSSNNYTATTLDFPPWALASCPRGDYQCVYQAPTPCTVLVDGLRGHSNETVFMHEGHAQDLRRMGKFKRSEYETARILVMKARVVPFNKWNIQDKIQSRLHDIATQLIDDMRGTASPEQIKVLETAASRIINGTSNGSFSNGYNTTNEYDYSSRYSKTAHAALLYILRPNRKYQRISDNIVDSLVPKNMDRSLTIGLPIRGSDKCRVESVCYGFDTYMKLMKRMWRDNLQSPAGKQATIVLTTEDETIMQARNAYESNGSFPFHFIVNSNDTFQGSGHPANYKEQADDVMLSSIVSLKMQLRTKFVVGNCCSNFHLMLFDLVHSGCGAVANVKPQCLQEHPDPEFFICCEWTQSEVCNARKEKQKEERVKRWEQKQAEEKLLKEEKKRLGMTDEERQNMAERKRLQKIKRNERKNH